MNNTLFNSAISCSFVLHLYIFITFFMMQKNSVTIQFVEIAAVIFLGTMTSMMNHGTTGLLWKTADRLVMFISMIFVLYLVEFGDIFEPSLDSSITHDYEKCLSYLHLSLENVTKLGIALAITISCILSSLKVTHIVDLSCIQTNRLHVSAHIIVTITLCYIVYLVAHTNHVEILPNASTRGTTPTPYSR